MSSFSKSTLSKSDYALFVLLIVGMVFRCLVSNSSRPFWCDEMQSLALFHQGWGAALNLFWHEQILPAPPLYVLFGGGWMTLFGLSDLALRSFSCVSLIAGAAILWVHLRRGYGVWITAFAVGIPFTSAAAITNNLSEARFYGLYIAAVTAFLVSIQRSYREPNFKHLLLQALTSAMVVTCHFHGLFYVSFLTLFVLLLLLKQGKVRQAVWVVVASSIGCFALLSWIFPLLAYSHALNFSVEFKGYFKELLMTYGGIIPLPGRGLLDTLHYFNTHDSFLPLSFVGVIVFLLAIFFLLKVPCCSPQSDCSSTPPDVELQCLIATGLFLLPILLWIVLLIHPSMFVNRYLTPSVLWAPFIIAPILNRENVAHYIKGWLPLLLFLLLLCNVVGTGIRGGNERKILRQDIEQLGTGTPVVYNNFGDWAVFSRYAKKGDFLYIQDKETALGMKCLDSDRASFYISQGFRHQGFDGVVDLSEFVKTHDSFLVVTRDNFKLLDGLFLNNPDYSCQKIGTFPPTLHSPLGAKVLRVERSY